MYLGKQTHRKFDGKVEIRRPENSPGKDADGNDLMWLFSYRFNWLTAILVLP
ncbi:MAG: hypothetical protein CM15mP32_0170 [Flavobacteriaceae bacterium]|nr:MAG: hypothetical protein CM15mP32_0170 [Flavobacteriaceae bacterium]